MTRPLNRRRGSVIGGSLIASHLHDSRLDQDVSVNNEPARIQVGDAQLNLVRLRCAGCGQVGMVFKIEPPAASGRTPFLYTETQIITSWDELPPTSMMVRNMLTPDAPVIQADCPAHGIVEFESTTAIALARRAEGRYKIAVFDAKPTGQRRSVRCNEKNCCTMTLEEFEALRGRLRNER